jgi:hypothetical protein
VNITMACSNVPGIACNFACTLTGTLSLPCAATPLGDAFADITPPSLPGMPALSVLAVGKRCSGCNAVCSMPIRSRAPSGECSDAGREAPERMYNDDYTSLAPAIRDLCRAAAVRPFSSALQQAEHHPHLLSWCPPCQCNWRLPCQGISSLSDESTVCKSTINLLRSHQQSASLSSRHRVHAPLMQLLLVSRQQVRNST